MNASTGACYELRFRSCLTRAVAIAFRATALGASISIA